MLGGCVELTDVASVVPLIDQNIRLNFESALWAQQVSLREQFGSANGAELDWTVPQQLSEFHGPYDLVVCTDCVYHENLVRDLARVVLHCASTKTIGAALLHVHSHVLDHPVAILNSQPNGSFSRSQFMPPVLHFTSLIPTECLTATRIGFAGVVTLF